MRYLSGYILAAVCLLSGLLISCGRSDPIPCTDKCENPGDTRCNGMVLQVCAETDRHCTQWQDWVDCSYYDQVCSESAGSTECSRTCSDKCDFVGDTRCDSTVIQTCALGEKGCLNWMGVLDCSDFGESCKKTDGDAHCAIICEDECTIQGSTKCGGTFILTCAINFYGCFYWEFGRDCADSGLICDDTGGNATCGPCTKDCSGRQCGPDPVCGQSCGTCMGATEVCRLDTGQCEDVCAGKDCGTFEGIYCGACAGATEVCRQNTGLCDDVCDGKECGTFEGIFCGDCAGETEVCREVHTPFEQTGVCEDVCQWQECGMEEGIDCGTCPGDEICLTGQCFTPACQDGMCEVPAGNFWMGCNEEVDIFCDSDEYPYHEVYLDGFEIDMYEITQSQYFNCVLDNVCEMPECLFDPETHGEEPATCVSNVSAKTFCEWSGKRLCTEAEWEKAARGTDGRRYPWGDEPATCEYAVMHAGGDGCGTGAMMPVGSKPAGASPYGALDIAGNASEIVSDCYSQTYYNECSSGCTNPQGPGSCPDNIGVHRGGDFRHWASGIRTSRRNDDNISWGEAYIGFRCCR